MSVVSERSEDATKGLRPSISRFHWTRDLRHSIIECSHGYGVQKFKFTVHIHYIRRTCGKSCGEFFRSYIEGWRVSADFEQDDGGASTS